MPLQNLEERDSYDVRSMLVKRATVAASTLKRTMSTATSVRAASPASPGSKHEVTATTNTSSQMATSSSLPKPPISGLIGILKPSGCTSMSILDTLKPLLAQSKLFQIPADDQLKKNKFKSNRKRRRDTDRFVETESGSSVMAPKLGQGGTLDPLADGVLVLGIGSGTKRLQQFLDCTKEYKTVGLLGTSTLSYDADDPILHRKPYDHVNATLIEELLPSFTGKFKQLPPLYSAIRIEGKRLFDYAREGKDLPRPIEGRDVEVTHMRLVDWKEAGQHEYKEPTQECDEEERRVAIRARRLAGLEEAEVEGEVVEGQDEVRTNLESNAAEAREDKVNGSKEENSANSRSGPPTFTLQMTVSSGTYVRSIVHDIGVQAKSAAHVVRLCRTRQGDWISPEYQFEEGEDDGKLKKAIDWEVLKKAAEELSSKTKRQKKVSGIESKNDNDTTHVDKEDQDQLSEWENLLLDHMEVIFT